MIRKRQENSIQTTLRRFNLCSPSGVSAASFEYTCGATKSGHNLFKEWSSGTSNFPQVAAIPSYSSWDVSTGLQLAAQVPRINISQRDSCMLARNLRGFWCLSAHQPVCYLFLFWLFWCGEETLFWSIWQEAADTQRAFFLQRLQNFDVATAEVENHVLGQDTKLAPAALTGALRSPSTLEHIGLNPWIKLIPTGPASLLIAYPGIFQCRKFSIMRWKSCLSSFTLDIIWSASYMHFRLLSWSLGKVGS